MQVSILYSRPVGSFCVMKNIGPAGSHRAVASPKEGVSVRWAVGPSLRCLLGAYAVYPAFLFDAIADESRTNRVNRLVLLLIFRCDLVHRSVGP